LRKFFKSLESQKIQKDKAAERSRKRQQQQQQLKQELIQPLVKEIAELDSITFQLASQVRRKD